MREKAIKPVSLDSVEIEEKSLLVDWVRRAEQTLNDILKRDPADSGCRSEDHFETRSFVLRDTTRDRTIPLSVYLPQGEGPFPAAVISPGLGGNSVTYDYLGKHLAKNGFVVLQPVHEGSDLVRAVLKTPALSFHQKELVERVQDLKLVRDIVEQAGGGDIVPVEVDQAKVALIGHSFGALTTQVVAGVTFTDEEGESVSLVDDRYAAHVLMSGYGRSMPSEVLRIEGESYKNMQKPLLNLHAENDHVFTLGLGSDVHLDPLKESRSPARYARQIEGGRHVHFAQYQGSFHSQTVDITKDATTAFLKAHLMENEDSKRYVEETYGYLAV